MVSNKILSIVIPVFNKFNFTKSCLNDLSQLPSDHEIIVIDNGSSDETSSLKNSTEITYHQNETNLGFAKACNIGYGFASAPNILFLNNDIRVQSNKDSWTKSLIDKCSEGLVGPTMGQLNEDLKFVKEANVELSGLSYLSGWCIAASREIWSKFHIPRQETSVQSRPQIFSEEFGLAYFEDTDLGFRAKQLNVLMQVVNVPLIHFKKQSSNQINTNMLYNQAREIFIKKWAK